MNDFIANEHYTHNYGHVVSFMLHRAISIAQSTCYWGKALSMA